MFQRRSGLPERSTIFQLWPTRKFSQTLSICFLHSSSFLSPELNPLVPIVLESFISGMAEPRQRSAPEANPQRLR